MGTRERGSNSTALSRDYSEGASWREVGVLRWRGDIFCYEDIIPFQHEGVERAVTGAKQFTPLAVLCAPCIQRQHGSEIGNLVTLD